MTTYSGPAVLVDANGNEHDVTASLHADPDAPPGRKEWGGRLDGLDDAVVWEAMDDGTPWTLRLPDGAEGRVLVSGGGDVTGSGAPPFSA